MPYEVIESFNRTIADYTNEIEVILASSDSATPASIDAMLELLSKANNLLTSNSAILPSYDIDHTQAKISDYQKRIQEKRNSGTKKTFSFKSAKKAVKAPSSQVNPIEKVTEQPSTSAKEVEEDIDPNRSVRNLEGQKIIITENQLMVEGTDSKLGDFTLYKLSGCEVRVMGLTTAMRLSHLTDCVVIGAPVNGSIFVQHCKNLTLHSASRQIRIHDTTDSTFLIYTQSRPTIEHCHGLKFGPYDVSHDSMQSWLDKCDFVLEKNEWQNVQDFLWLLRTNSPNWTPVPENERSTIAL